MLNTKHCARLGSLYFVPVLALCALAPKLYFLQVVQREHYAQRAEKQHTGTTKLAPTRGKIFDAKGHELAGSALVTVAYMDPRVVAAATSGSLARKPRKAAEEDDDAPDAKTREEAKLAAAATVAAAAKSTTGTLTPADPQLFAYFTRDLAKALHWDPERLRRVLTESRRPVRLPLDLNENDRAKIENVFATWRTSMPRKAVWFEDVNRRHYPHDDMGAHIVGYTIENETGDNKGMAGIEKSYDEELRGTSVTLRARTNAMQNLMEPADNELLNSTYGHSVVLTIDDNIQEATERALAKVVLEEAADSAVGIVLRVKTGEVLAMASVPTYRISNQKFSSESEKRNRVVSNAIEPGSVMKIFTFSCLFDQGRATPEDIIDTNHGVFTIGSRTVRDVHSIDVASIRTIFEQSSNVGTVKAAMRLKPSLFYQQLRKFGFGEQTDVDLPAESPGLLRPYSRWSGLSMSSIPMGYELQVTALQVAAGAAVIGNHGWYMQPHLVKEIRDVQGNVIQKIEPKPLRRVIGEDTCRSMISMMEQVVDKGTGKTAQIAGYRIGGKTGTTKKLDPVTKQYTRSNYIASFCGIAPLSDPELCIYVYVDNPQLGDYYGGKVAGPVFKEIAQNSLKALHIAPDADSAPVAKRGVDSLQYSKTAARETKAKELAAVATPQPLSIETLKMSLESRVPMDFLERRPPPKASKGTMPKLEGLTMKEAQQELLKLGLPFEFFGSGVVINQIPGAYETLEGGDIAKITFGTERELLERAVVSIAGEQSTANPFSPDAAEDAMAKAALKEFDDETGAAEPAEVNLPGRSETGIAAGKSSPDPQLSSAAPAPNSSAGKLLLESNGRAIPLPIEQVGNRTGVAAISTLARQSASAAARLKAERTSRAAPPIYPDLAAKAKGTAQPAPTSTTKRSTSKKPTTNGWADYEKQLAARKAEAQKAALTSNKTKSPKTASVH